MKIKLTILFLLLNIYAFAQETTASIEMADLMRSNGKIYVVVACLLIIFLILAIYLIVIDKKISKLKNQ